MIGTSMSKTNQTTIRVESNQISSAAIIEALSHVPKNMVLIDSRLQPQGLVLVFTEPQLVL